MLPMDQTTLLSPSKIYRLHHRIVVKNTRALDRARIKKKRRHTHTFNVMSFNSCISVPHCKCYSETPHEWVVWSAALKFFLFLFYLSDRRRGQDWVNSSSPLYWINMLHACCQNLIHTTFYIFILLLLLTNKYSLNQHVDMHVLLFSTQKS